jgi:predicted dehydrogenase
VEAVSVAVPTREHFRVASYFIERGKHVLVEKPMTSTIDEAKALVELARDHNVVLQVGHVERFNPVLEAVDRFGIRPLFIEAHRISPFRFRSADIGVVMDLMIHDLDIVFHLVNSKVSSFLATGVNVLGELEDIANVRLVFESGCVANLTASRVAIKTQRTIRIFSRDSYVSLDYGMRKATMFRKAALLREGKLPLLTGAKAGAPPEDLDFRDLVESQEIEIPDEEPLRRELASFVDSALHGKAPAVSGEEGLRALEVSFAVVAEIRRYLDRIRNGDGSAPARE